MTDRNAEQAAGESGGWIEAPTFVRREDKEWVLRLLRDGWNKSYGPGIQWKDRPPEAEASQRRALISRLERRLGL